MDDGYGNWTRLSAQTANAYRERRGDPLTEGRQQKETPLQNQARERGLDAAPVNWARVIDERLGAERERTSALLVEIVAELRHDSADEIERACRTLTAELADLKATLAELRLVLASDRTKLLDPPRLLAPNLN